MADIVVYETEKHRHLAQSFVDIHMACTIDDPRTVANFTLPFTPERQTRMREYWEHRLHEARPGSTDTIIMAFSKNTKGDAVLSGYVTLHQPVTESGPFRGLVQRLFVSPDFRRQGIARNLMAKLEEVAGERGRTLLVRWLFVVAKANRVELLTSSCYVSRRLILPDPVLPDTCTPNSDMWRCRVIHHLCRSPANDGQFGILPDYIVNAETKELMDAVEFYKDLRKV